MGKNSRVEMKPIADKAPQEKIEDELPDSLKQPKITSEIDYLKKIKLRAQIRDSAKATDSERIIASFKTEDDERIETVYEGLISLYARAMNYKNGDKKIGTETDYLKLSKLYSEFGHKDLYAISANIARLQKVQKQNEEILEFSTEVRTTQTEAIMKMLKIT